MNEFWEGCFFIFSLSNKKPDPGMLQTLLLCPSPGTHCRQSPARRPHAAAPSLRVGKVFLPVICYYYYYC